MSIIEGYLEETDSKDGKTKRGKPWTMYRGKINGSWLSFGFQRPNVRRGDYVRLTVEKDENDYDVVTDSKAIDPPAQQKSATGSGTQTGTSYDARQGSIVYQSSRKDALALVDVLISQDALPITSAKTAAGKAKRYEELMALVDKLTVRYFYDAQTLRNLERVQDEGADGPAPDALPEDDQEEDDAPTQADVEDAGEAGGADGSW